MSLKVKIKIAVDNKEFETTANFSPSMLAFNDVESCVRNATFSFLDTIKKEGAFSSNSSEE